MARATNKRDSIYIQLLRLLTISAVTAAIVFLMLNWTLESAITVYYENSDYEERQDKMYIEKLQTYIDRHRLASKDADALNSWVKRQRILSMQIYKDGIQVFDSEYPDQELWEKGVAADHNEWETYFELEFVDGKAQARLNGIYAYQFYNYAFVVGLVVSFGLFLFLVLFGIRKKMNYIRKLSSEIEILEGGGLDYPITVTGKDELAALAEGLESMRLSIGSLMKQEAEMVRENQKIITEMSHDIRTPVTSILLYAEILKKGKYQNDSQLREYIDKIDRKAHRMKQLTDNLFEYSLVSGKAEVILGEPESFGALFYDAISETYTYLLQKGFVVKMDAEWADTQIRVCTDYVNRILDNITSNIVKYADEKKSVMIRTVCHEDEIGFVFQNTVKKTDEKVESTHVGIQSVKNMMEKMGGSYAVRQGSGEFEIGIFFPVCQNQDFGIASRT